MRNLWNLILLLRPHNVAAAMLSVAAGFALAGGRQTPVLLLAAVAFATAAGNIINDICDVDIDRVNKPRRPLAAGTIPMATAKMQYAVLVAGAAVIAFLRPLPESLWVVSWLILLHLYSARFKRLYLVGNVLVAAVSASGFLLGALAAGDVHAGFIPAALTFLFIMGREIVKDAADVAGDSSCGARTFPIVSGRRAALVVSAAIFGLLVGGFILPFAYGVYGTWYIVIMSVSVLPILIVSIMLTLADRFLGLVSALLKVGMFFGILAFFLGRCRAGL